MLYIIHSDFREVDLLKQDWWTNTYFNLVIISICWESCINGDQLSHPGLVQFFCTVFRGLVSLEWVVIHYGRSIH